jgi:hypothetical protein
MSRSYAPTTPDAIAHMNRSLSSRPASTSKSKDALPELANAFARARTTQQFAPVLNDALPPPEVPRGHSRLTFEADAMFTVASPGASGGGGGGGFGSRDRQEQQQVLRRTRQELCVLLTPNFITASAE